MATPPKQFPLTADEVKEGERLGKIWQDAADARDRWFVKMDRKYRDQYHHLPSHASRIAGASRWTYIRAIRAAAEREQDQERTA